MAKKFSSDFSIREKPELNFWPTDVILALTSKTLPESLLSYQGEWEGCDVGPLDTGKGWERQAGQLKVLVRPEVPGTPLPLNPGYTR